MTQKFLGIQVEFPEKSADARLAQSESGTRTPKADATEVLDLSPLVPSVPGIDSYLELMHTRFTLEDRCSLHVDEMDGAICLEVDVRKNREDLLFG